MRLRIRYEKLGKVRFLSHRDVARVLERAVRRAGLPVAYSEGFSPHARLHFGLALSVGHESFAEYLDVDLVPAAPRPATHEVPALLSGCLPDGLTATAAVELVPGTMSLQESVTSSAWEFRVAGAPSAELIAAAEELLAADELPVEITRKGKQVREDLRPLLLDLSTEATSYGARLRVELGTKPRSVRPAEFLAALGARCPSPGPGAEACAEARVLRTHQWITHDGVRREPIELAAPSPHAVERAS
ncbi:MAG: TIGR03936 family radical SAM-associated protein [Microthrixaceae bacterium]